MHHVRGYCEVYQEPVDPDPALCADALILDDDLPIEDVSTCDYPAPVVDDETMPFIVL
jgi:hypothetical protein